jgi:4-amino-4-deoxy-L-arabinose transferase-like glycosyltransferase
VLAWEPYGVALILAWGVFAHADNLFGYPRYDLDEGTYVAAAWAVLHGQIYPYTYTYVHPPLGWTLIAIWTWMTGGFFTFGTAINSARVLMIVLAACSALLVYLIARNISRSPWVAALATLLFSLSPLSVQYQREVLLDNIATFWMLLALYLFVIHRGRLRLVAMSAVALGVAVLSKETLVALYPAFIYAVWLYASSFHRRFAFILFTYICLSLGSAFVLLALLKGELFPTGTPLGGSEPHVSLIGSLAQQVARGSSQGSLATQWGVWWRADALFMLASMLAIAGNLFLSRRNPWLRVVSLLALSYWLFLARGGVTFAYYLLPLIPLQALNIALFAHAIARAVSRAIKPAVVRPHMAWLQHGYAATTVALLLICVLFATRDLRLNNQNRTVDAVAPQTAAIQWIGAHVPRSAIVVANDYLWVDLRAEGGPATRGGEPFAYIEMYWEVATDPAITQGLLHDDWNNIDYVVADSDLLSDVPAFHMRIISDALDHAVPVQRFANSQFQVTIYQVQHRGVSAPSTPSSTAENVGALTRP